MTENNTRVEELELAMSQNAVLRQHVENGGEVWTTAELEQAFKVHSFQAPFLSASKRDTSEKGTLTYHPRPRFYYGWVPADSHLRPQA